MRRFAEAVLPVMALIAAVPLFAGCGRTSHGAYFNGLLTVNKDSVCFRDQANYITMPVGEESLAKLGVPTGNAVRESACYWIEFYGHAEGRSLEESPGTDLLVHVGKLIKIEPRDTIPAAEIMTGFYECLIDGVRQQIVLRPNYVYVWTIYPDSKYEIITYGSWQRTAERELLLRPFDRQPDLSGTPSGFAYAGTVETDESGEVRVYADSTKAASSPKVPTEISEAHLSERIRRQRELNRQKAAEEDARKRATPRPGITRFEFDPDSNTLVDKGNEFLVLWKVYL